jgi:hypothetical protein
MWQYLFGRSFETAKIDITRLLGLEPLQFFAADHNIFLFADFITTHHLVAFEIFACFGREIPTAERRTLRTKHA